jgi:prefoldin subunit 2
LLTLLELQNQYSTYKNTLQQLAQKIGDVEQEAEEHKYDLILVTFKIVSQLLESFQPLPELILFQILDTARSSTFTIP